MLLSVKEVVEELRKNGIEVSAETIYRYVRKGELEEYVVRGRGLKKRRIYLRKEVIDYLLSVFSGGR